MPPLLADFSHAKACKPFCEKYLTLPKAAGYLETKQRWRDNGGKSSLLFKLLK